MRLVRRMLVYRGPLLGPTCPISSTSGHAPYSSYPCPPVSLPQPRLDWDYLTDPANLATIQRNIGLRKNKADIQRVQELYKEIYLNDDIHELKSEQGRKMTQDNLLTAGLAVPNMCPASVIELGKENRTIYEQDFTKPEFKIRTFEEIARILSGARLKNLGLLSGEKSYYLTGPLAELEQALVQWTVDMLVARGFSLLSVPDILHPDIIEGCGMRVEGERTQVTRAFPPISW